MLIASAYAGAWLWALLAMSPHEFVLAIRLWPGIPAFPFPPEWVRVRLWSEFSILLEITF